MIALEITWDDAAMLAELQGIEIRAADLSGPFAQIGESLLEDARTEIASSKGGLFQAPWTPMSRFTVWFHHRDPSDLLHDTGALLGSLEQGAGGNIFEVGPSEAAFGTRFRTAAWQHKGTSRTFLVLQYMRSGGTVREWQTPGIPARPFIGWREERVPEYLQLIAMHVFNAQA